MQEAQSKSRTSTIMDQSAIAAGAMLGVSARWYVSTALNTSAYFPFGTLTVNLVGCLLVGASHAWLREYPAQRLRLALIVGLLGAFTTFSTFSIETVLLLLQQRVIAALLYQGLSIGAGVGAVVFSSTLMGNVIRWRTRGRDS